MSGTIISPNQLFNHIKNAKYRTRAMDNFVHLFSRGFFSGAFFLGLFILYFIYLLFMFHSSFQTASTSIILKFKQIISSKQSLVRCCKLCGKHCTKSKSLSAVSIVSYCYAIRFTVISNRVDTWHFITAN